jgi:3-deoxy-manno-octulosonate cytidylyltransferase (CMP-KDO synthetase)
VVFESNNGKKRCRDSQLAQIIVVIPARYGSTRFQAKVLAKDSGKFLVQHTYERALCADSVNSVFIATDSEMVRKACETFGAKCIMTSPAHQSGTDRIAEAVKEIEADVIINLQADEPEIEPAYIDSLAGLLTENPNADIATLVAGFDDPQQIADANVVKVVTDSSGRAIYFSRSAIPYDRESGGIGPVELYLRHLGIYAFRRDALVRFTSMPQSSLEKTEKLEQLRAIENGLTIITEKVDRVWDGIDTPAQYAEFLKRLKQT